jgi:hypothetical protein
LKGGIGEEMSQIKKETKKEIKVLLENYILNERKCSDICTNFVNKESTSSNFIEGKMFNKKFFSCG